MPKTRFIIEYSTNLTGDRKFLLTNKNIQNELEKLKKEKKKKSFIVGETVVYLDPNDKDRYGMKAVIKKLYIDPASDKAVYDIKFMNRAARDWKPLSKGKRKLKNVSSTYLYQDNSALGIWAMGFITHKSLYNSKIIDNKITKLIKALLKKGTIFIPTAILNKATNKFNKPKPKQQFKIRDYIINVQIDDANKKKLFRRKDTSGKSQIIISVNLFLQETRGPGGKAIPFSMKRVKSNINMSCDYHLNALKNIGKRIIGGSRNSRGGGFTGAWIVRKNKPSIRKFIKDHLTPELVNNTEMGDSLLEDLKLVIDNNDVDDDEYIFIERHEEMVSIEGKTGLYIFSWNCCPDREEAGMLCDELEEENAEPYPTQCKWIDIVESTQDLHASAQHGGCKKTRKKRKKRNRKTRRK